MDSVLHLLNKVFFCSLFVLRMRSEMKVAAIFTSMKNKNEKQCVVYLEIAEDVIWSPTVVAFRHEVTCGTSFAKDESFWLSI